jgi:hypothetical protein
MDKNISILLGAGFSAPMGYPIGNKLNDLLLKSNEENFGFHTSGSLVVNIDGSKPDFGYKISYDIEFEFCFELMNYFKQTKGYFDYEKFYDYILDEVKEDKGVNKVAEPFLNDITDLSSLIYGLKNVYTQVVSFYLKDRDGNKYYDNLPYAMGHYYPGYSGIMKCISDFAENFIVNIHTLNHDLFFERFNNTDFLKGELSDGFEELGSPYYGNIDVNSRKYMVRLSRYTGNYEGKFKLYKLHGSLNYEPYYRTEKGVLIPETYIKSGYAVGHTEHYKEKVNEEGKLEYENSWINYHSDFLTGTTSKIERYTEPLLFKKLFELFKTNLKSAEKLIIIGYGAKDKEINNIIIDHFDYNSKKAFIIDPYAGDQVKEFGVKLKATIIEKQLENIEIKDLE